jgi:hypothetical protein
MSDESDAISAPTCRGTSDSPLRPTKSDPLSGQALHKETCVRMFKA